MKQDSSVLGGTVNLKSVPHGFPEAGNGLAAKLPKGNGIPGETLFFRLYVSSSTVLHTIASVHLNGMEEEGSGRAKFAQGAIPTIRRLA